MGNLCSMKPILRKLRNRIRHQLVGAAMGRLDAVDGKLDAIDGKLETLDTRLDRLQQELRDMRDLLETVLARSAASSELVAAALEDIARTESRLQEVEQVIGAH
jgi:chromosome segregation ATPase